MDQLLYEYNIIINFMKDTNDSIANDVKLYSNGLIIALENKQHPEYFDCVQKIKKCLKMVDGYLEMRKDIESKDQVNFTYYFTINNGQVNPWTR